MEQSHIINAKRHNLFVKHILLLTGFCFIMSCDKSTEPEDNIKYGSLTDIEGNVYATVQIGNQIWMAENLRTTKYNDGTSIPHLTDGTEWTNTKSGAYCFYNNTTNEDSINKNGALYNWYAVDTKKLAPSGWHIANDLDWNILIIYLFQNGYSYNGRLNSDTIASSLASKTDWETTSSHTGAIGDNLEKNNKTGFSAFPAGGRYGRIFEFMGNNAYWWLPIEKDSLNAYSMKLDWINDAPYSSDYPKYNGFAVRLVKD